MKRANLIRFVALSALLVLCPAKSPARQSYGGPAKEYVLTAGNEQLRFVPQGEKGYVVKQPKRTAGVSALAGTLFLEEGRVRPIGGLDRHGIWIVENDGPASRNNAVMAELIQNGAAEYVAPLFSSGGETVAIIPEIVVRVKPDTNVAELQSLCESVGCRIRKRMEFTEQEYLLEVLGPDAEAVFAAVEELGQAPEVEWACPNTASRLRLAGETLSAGERLYAQDSAQDAAGGSTTSGVIPNDEYFPMQWHLHNTGQSGGTPGADIHAPEAWEITTGDPNIVVALIDCGVDSRHPDLIDNLVPGYDFYDNDDQPDPALDHPTNTHGTACAGLIAAQGNNGIGVTGVTWTCKVMAIRVGRVLANGTGSGITVADTATAFRWAAAQGADILSNSWIGYSSDQPIIQSAVIDVTVPGGLGRDGKGCVFLSAAGNGAGPIKSYPLRYPEVIAVGATDPCDIRWHYSNYGPELDIVAPSGCWTDLCAVPTPMWTTDIVGRGGWDQDNILDVNILDYTDAMEGTSGACPVAAGVAALILSVEPNLTSEEVRHFLERSAKDLVDPGRDDYYGWGRVDARAALDMVLAKRADLNNDWKVDFSDFAVFAQCWKTDDLRGDIGPIPRPDGVLDVQDLALLGDYWLREIPELGLFAHWKLDETEGETPYERVNHRDGTLHGGPLWQPAGGKVNGALEFDGINDYVSTPFILDPAAGAFSIFAWVKGGGPEQAIISQAGGVNWLAAGTSQGKLMTELKAPGRYGTPLFSEVVIIDGEWHRVGLTWDGSTRTLFADGVEVAKGTQSTLAGSAGGLYIGAGSAGRGEPGSFWSGLIDDFKIYDRAVTP
jgi:subtilisin family serine protease